jgi:hypothetical protein
MKEIAEEVAEAMMILIGDISLLLRLDYVYLQ